MQPYPFRLIAVASVRLFVVMIFAGYFLEFAKRGSFVLSLIAVTVIVIGIMFLRRDLTALRAYADTRDSKEEIK